MKHSFKTILLLFALIFLVRSHDETTCNHHEHQEQNPPGFLEIEEDLSSLEAGRILAAEEYPQFRIYANYDYLDKTAPSSYASYIKNELAPPVLAYYEAALKIKYPVSGTLKLASSVKTLCSMNTPTALKNGVEADFAILFNSRSESTSILATSYNCYISSGTKRPIVASTNFNRGMLKEAKGDMMAHEKNTYLLFHEIMHTLGFSKSLYKYFVDGNGKTLSGHIKDVKIAGSTRPVIDVPSLTQRLREFHGCSSIPGAIMSSGDASHWDKKMYLYETMQSGSVYGKRLSALGLGMLEASGWYVVDYSYAEPYFYGQGQGCDFMNGVCSSSKVVFDEFCSGSSRGCGFMGNSGGSCSSGSSMGNCKYVIPSTSSNCENPSAAKSAKLSSVEAYGLGSGSRCFTGTLSTKKSSSTSSFCFKYNCVGSGSSTQLEVLLGNEKAICSKEGTASVNGYYGVVNCPDPLTFCNTVGKRFCPKGCMGRGQCVDNQCQCYSGFTGADCGLNA